MDVWMLQIFQGVRFIRFKICGHIDTDETQQKRGRQAPFFNYVDMLYFNICPYDIA